MTEAVPSLLADRYLMGAELGTGGMARVYRAWDGVLHREVAVKLLRQVVGDPQARERFEREGRFMAMLDHPGLVPVLDAGTVDDHPFLVLQLVRGTSLGDYCRATRPDLGETARIGAALADALAYVHAQGVVHRDVKPGNVLVRDDGHVMLTDFGIARLLGDTSRLTSTGIVLGTAAYLAPEQVRGLSGTAAADIYALALVLMEMLAGRPVFSGPPDVAALARLVAPPVVPEDLPAPLRNLLRAMTADDAGDRPVADDVARRLRTLSDDQGEPLSTTAETFGTAPLPVRWRPSRPLVLGLASGAAALALVPIIALMAGETPGGSAWLPGVGAGATPSAKVSQSASTVRPATQPGTTPPRTTPPRTTRPSTKGSATQGTATPSVLPTSAAVTSTPADDKDKSGKSNSGKHKGKGKGKDNSD